jgi:hypothetical protein
VTACARLITVASPPNTVAPQAFLNFHSGRLPFYRGLYALWRAMTAGDSHAACVLHVIDEGVDTGQVFKVRGRGDYNGRWVRLYAILLVD